VAEQVLTLLAQHIQVQEIKEDQEVLEVEAEAHHPLLMGDRVDYQHLVKVLEEAMAQILRLVQAILQVLVLDIKQVAEVEQELEVKMDKM
jgi:hypothetical protein